MTVLFANNINLQFPMSLKHSHSLFCHSFCTISVILVLVNDYDVIRVVYKSLIDLILDDNILQSLLILFSYLIDI